ncbi:major capsid protein [Microviridae sp.]|nr:major capsid protein [Microviridae sp.]
MQKQHSTSVRPTQIWPENYKRGAVQHNRTRRHDYVSAITSSFGGKFVPLSIVPLLREDGVLNSTLSINLQMAETADMLLNPVRVSAMAYLVPKLALDRFKDMGTIDRSYASEPEIDGSVVPWFETAVASDDIHEIHRTLGLHVPGGQTYNTDYVESFNAVWNYIALQRSSSLEKRDRLASSLPPAFWEHTQMRHVVPTFDAAMVEGNIPITFVSGSDELDIFRRSNAQAWKVMTAGTDNEQGNGELTSASSVGQLRVPAAGGTTDSSLDPMGGLYAKLAAEGVQISLANIEQARETRAWSELRAQYQGISEDWMIDQLLAGIRLNDEVLKQPILLDHADTVVGMSERYATDGDNLAKSVADGRTSLSLKLRAPALQTGGCVVICGQVLPEMIYERQRDYYFRAETVDELPNRTADELDPQPVETIKNGEVDESHAMQDDLFGYAPLNHRWMRRAPKVGGKYFRSNPTDPWDENRNRIWSTEVENPTLGPDFYLSSTLSHEVFADSNTDPFEWWVTGDVGIEGLTYFGATLREALGDYEAIEAQVPTERLKGDGTDEG